MTPGESVGRQRSAALAADCAARLKKDLTQSLKPLIDDSLLDWLSKAAQLPGKSLHLAVVLCFLACVRDTYQVVLNNSTSQQFGVDRNAKYRAMRWLENAGLIRVDRKLGRSPLVTILGQRGGYCR